MSTHRYYYYDQDQCTFVEVKPSKKRHFKQVGLVLCLSLVFAAVLYWGMRDFFGSPEVIALRTENDVLREQLSKTEEQMLQFSFQLDEFARQDDELYRTILQAEPITDGVREAGVGGVDPYSDFQQFSPETRTVLRRTAEKADQLTRQLHIQNNSYRELIELAKTHNDRLTEMPSIIPTQGRLVSGFGIRMHPIDRVSKMHYGLDITAPTGTKIFAAGNGIISFSGNKSGYGKTIEISHPKSGYTTRYGHMSKLLVTAGTRVKKGDLIGLVGSTGRSTAPHLHYEVRLTNNMQALNPIDFFALGMTAENFKKLRMQAENALSPLD